jgi:hypothetical protein
MSKQYAFPTHTLNVPFAEADDPKHNGMELRDYFAAKAMQGLFFDDACSIRGHLPRDSGRRD